MKNELPSYRREAGQPRNESKITKIKESFSSADQNKINDYMTELRMTMTSKDTLAFAEAVVVGFLDVIENQVSNIKRKDLVHYVTLINNSDKTHSARSKYFYFVKRFLKMNLRDLTLLDVIRNKRTTGNNSPITKGDLITPQELEAMLRRADSMMTKALLMLLYESGGRPDEILKLKWKDIIFNDDGISVISLFSGKKKETRTILVKDCVIHLRRWKAEYSYPDITPNDYVFVGKTRDTHRTSQFLNKFIQRLAKECGIEKKVWSYLFRHTRLTFMRQKLKTPLYVKYAGHSERQASSYTHLDVDDLKEALLSDVYQTEEIAPERKEELQEQLIALTNKVNELHQLMNKNKEKPLKTY